MALFTLAEFASYMQQDVDTSTSTLLLELVQGLVEEVTGLDYDVVTPSATAKSVGLEAAARAYRNPGGVTSRSEAIDDYSVTDRWEAGASTADLGVYLTDAEIARLRGLARVRSVVLQQP